MTLIGKKDKANQFLFLRNQDSEKDRNKPTEANISEKKPEKEEGEEKPSQKENKGIYEL